MASITEETTKKINAIPPTVNGGIPCLQAVDFFDQIGGRPAARVKFETKRLKDFFPLVVPQGLRHCEPSAKGKSVVFPGHDVNL
jgi:hypothetical protein